jgi:hypothetical protein
VALVRPFGQGVGRLRSLDAGHGRESRPLAVCGRTKVGLWVPDRADGRLVLLGYPDEALVTLYRRRWAVELFFREIKTTLGLDVLRCQSPELVEKEVWLQAIAYNPVRALMLEAAWTCGVALERLSFKGTVDTLRQWTPLFAPSLFAFKRAREELLRIIAADQVPDRPNRSEPRAKKRRPKSYQLLTRPRRRMVVSPSRALK